MTKEEYEYFVLRYKGCGACFPMYHTLSRFEKMWFTAIQKDVAELENKIADIKANCDLAIEGRDVKIMELEKDYKVLQASCDILKDNDEKIIKEMGEQIEKMKCYLPVDERDSNHKWFAYKNLFDTEWNIDYSVQGELPKCNTIKWFENKEAVMFYLVSNGMKYYEEPRR